MSHESPKGATVEWYTPPEFFTRLGDVEFFMDPASPGKDIVPWVPANIHVTKDEDGMKSEWVGPVWLNPPYGPDAVPFIDRMLDHRYGMLLIPSRTETAVFQRAARSAGAVCFLRDRIHFIRGDGYQARSGFASVLMAWGLRYIDALEKADLGWMP